MDFNKLKIPILFLMFASFLSSFIVTLIKDKYESIYMIFELLLFMFSLIGIKANDIGLIELVLMMNGFANLIHGSVSLQVAFIITSIISFIFLYLLLKNYPPS